MATAADITDEYRCGYCWQEFCNMDDPRELPCHHVFCMTCLQADYQEKNGVLNCPYCQEAYENIDFGKLATAQLAKKNAPPVTTLKCDGDNCPGNLAVSYCIDCSDKVCDEHLESHNSHFGDRHRVVSIHTYEEHPENFRKPVCDRHQDEIVNKACKGCDKLICAECDRYADECVGGAKHEYCSINSLDETMIKSYRDLLKKADEKLTKMCKLEKNTWGSLDQDDVVRKQLIEEAEREKAEKIKNAEEMCKKVIQRIKYDQDKTTRDVEGFNAQLAEKKETLDDMRGKTRQLMNEGSVVEKIRQRKEVTAKLLALVDEELGTFLLDQYKLPPLEDILFEDKISQVFDPDRINLSDNCSIMSKKTCYDIDYLPNGGVLLAGNRSFDICDRTGKITRTIFSKEGDFTSIQCYKKKIYGLLKEPKGSSKRMAIVFDMDTYVECHRWALPDYGFVSMLAVSNDKVYIVDSNAKKVIVYSLTGQFLSDFSHAAFKNPVYMCPYYPNGILLSDWAAGTVFKIDSVSDQVEWEFQVPTPRGVYCDKFENVWVWSSKEKALYLRTANGKKIKQFKHKKLVAAGVEYICGFFLGDDKLWGAACGKGVVRIQINISDP